MADEAFALSPISARAAKPSEEDYDAIRQAFMETSRGRWFLGEYAKRNRNADTSMVLEAVARLEENLAAQRQPQPVPDNGLKDALAAVRSAVDEARVTSLAALDGLALEDRLAPVRKGSRIIREIAWRWREIGADGRICDLLDSQVGAIEDACGDIASIDPMGALSGAFDVVDRQLAELGGEAAPASPQAAAEDIPSASAPPVEIAVAESLATAGEDSEAAMTTAPTEEAVATAEATEATADIADVAAATADVAADAIDAVAETAGAATETVDAVAETTGATAETTDAITQTANAIARTAAETEPVTAEAVAHDDAILDMIALEMAADDPYDGEDIPDTGLDETGVAALAPAEPVSVAPEPEPIAAAAEPAAFEPSLQPSAEPEDSAEQSLGSSLIARGILSRPQAAGSDPLAPIRRLSQAEKIALFS